MTLTEFLLARIAEDEAVARQATQAARLVSFNVGDNAESYAERAGALRHIARHDPARVLAECEAKRRIVGMHQPGAELCHWSHDSSAVHDDEPCRTLRLLAAVYADHSDYDESWRP